ncbi:hypothetical protein INP77_00480 [Methylophilus sp. 13]|uniref:hypothetical protein n=1 Tax=Methylophilus sp. 13 TaxID=2781018 RepID=UPI00188EEC8D|nr:hypothetical protein [Methylophilus sp. 13]MBF5037957.1 hypothetical protein [Methylophilus sp. 13]
MICLSKQKGGAKGYFHPTTAMTKEKKGRNSRDQFLKFRTLVWYWGVRFKTGLKNGKLDVLFTPKAEGRSYITRIKMFEEIEKFGSSLSDGSHHRRSFDLLKLVNDDDRLKGSKNLYESAFWEYLIESESSVESAMIQIEKMVVKLELQNAPLKNPEDIKNEELHHIYDHIHYEYAYMAVAELIKIRNIKDAPTREYADILFSFGSSLEFLKLVKDLDFQLLARYFNTLCLFIAIYRYSMLTGNFETLISSADAIKDLLNILDRPVKWLGPNKFKSNLIETIYSKIFHPSRSLTRPLTVNLKEPSYEDHNPLALNAFIGKINQVHRKYRPSNPT